MLSRPTVVMTIPQNSSSATPSETKHRKSAVPTVRSNPFNAEIYFDESHFSSPIIEDDNIMPTILTASNAELQTPTLTVSNADLGIAENHYETGRFGLSSVEELELAIDNCKDLIVASEEHSEKRKQLVKKLIELRINLLEVKEGTTEPSFEASQRILAHRFVQQNRSSSNRYCEHCNAIIWVLLQPWCKCKVCGFSCHVKCVNLIRRVCASVKVKEKGQFELRICPEVGLAAQKYRCIECKTKLVHGSKVREQEPRLCDYSGFYYCSNCHWNDEMVIPGRVVHNWDFTPYKVSRASKQFLKLMQRRPVLHLEVLNPGLFNYNEDLRLIRKTRSDILLMKCYFLCCHQAAKERLLNQLKKRQHFVDNANLYSLQDLMDLQSGALSEELCLSIDLFVDHIKRTCEACKGNGFVCELCPDKQIIFPFDDYIAVCRECYAVFHRLCFEKQRKQCPRCKRRARRASTLQSSEDFDDGLDEANSKQPALVTSSQSASSSDVPTTTIATYSSSSAASITTAVSTTSSFARLPDQNSAATVSGSAAEEPKAKTSPSPATSTPVSTSKPINPFENYKTPLPSTTSNNRGVSAKKLSAYLAPKTTPNGMMPTSSRDQRSANNNQSNAAAPSGLSFEVGGARRSSSSHAKQIQRQTSNAAGEKTQPSISRSMPKPILRRSTNPFDEDPIAEIVKDEKNPFAADVVEELAQEKNYDENLNPFGSEN